MTAWQQWLDRPEKFWFRAVLFQIHFWVGAAVGAYIFLLSLSGSAIVYRNELAGRVPIEWLVDFHANLLGGKTGRMVNGIGAISLVVLCVTGAVIWWPGTRHWRRSLTVDWRTSFARINWDLHSALGFWAFPFVIVWAVSGTYFTFPQLFNSLLVFDPNDRFTDAALSWLAQLHFGRFGPLSRAVWAAFGLVPAVLAFTGVFICCRRVIFHKPSNPNAQ